MNTEATLSLLRQLLTLVGGLLAGAGYLNAEQANTITNDVLTVVPALVSLGSVCWSIYAHWNQKKVPQSAVALELPSTVPTPAKGTHLDLTPLTGVAQVVG